MTKQTGFIKKQHKKWYAILDVPADVREHFGKRVFSCTLRTDSESKARKRAAPIVEGWKAQIANARGRTSDEQLNEDNAAFFIEQAKRAAREGRATAGDKKWLAEQASEQGIVGLDPQKEHRQEEIRKFRERLKRTKTKEERDAILLEISLEAEDIAFLYPDDLGGDRTSDPEAGEFEALASGKRVMTTEYVPDWIASMNAQKLKQKTIRERELNVGHMAKRFPDLVDLTKIEVKRWLDEIQTKRTATTAQKYAANCNAYFRYLKTIEIISDDTVSPFTNLDLRVRKQHYEPWKPEQCVALHRQAVANKDQELADLIKLAMYTGARRGELTSLRPRDIDFERGIFKIADAKTRAGVRDVPIAEEAVAVFQQLHSDALEKGRVHLFQSTGNKIGERFTNMKKTMGYTERKNAFHGLRSTVITQLERRGVTEQVTQDIVGHERSTLTGSTYSGKSTMEQRKEAIERLDYPWSK